MLETLQHGSCWLWKGVTTEEGVQSEALSELSNNYKELFCILAAGIRGPNRQFSVTNGVPRNTSP